MGPGVRRLDRPPILKSVRERRFPAWVLLLAATALLAGPGATLYAASPCNAGPPMACCGAEGDDGAPAPCSCSLSPVAPAPSVAETASHGVVLAEAPAPALTGPNPAPAASTRIAPPRARAAPLFLLFVAFLN